jgi:hypothetical protein
VLRDCTWDPKCSSFCALVWVLLWESLPPNRWWLYSLSLLLAKLAAPVNFASQVTSAAPPLLLTLPLSPWCSSFQWLLPCCYPHCPRSTPSPCHFCNFMKLSRMLFLGSSGGWKSLTDHSQDLAPLRPLAKKTLCHHYISMKLLKPGGYKLL